MAKMITDRIDEIINYIVRVAFVLMFSPVTADALSIEDNFILKLIGEGGMKNKLFKLMKSPFEHPQPEPETPDMQNKDQTKTKLNIRQNKKSVNSVSTPFTDFLLVGVTGLEPTASTTPKLVGAV